MKTYGLLGYPLGHSFSPLIHNHLFKLMNLDYKYELIECQNQLMLKNKIKELKNGKYAGFNVTIPYKKEVMKYLDRVSDEAEKIGAVNTIALVDGEVVGFNTDYYGFYEEIKYYNIDVLNKECFILGTGGASLAVNKALIDLGGKTKFVSRNKQGINIISYDELKNKDLYLVVNTTPVGMSPNINDSPLESDIISNSKYVIDIIFNPIKTLLLEEANSNMNGLLMLIFQALKAEEIWQNQKLDKYKDDLFEFILNHIK